jgi:preprotein translocase subunit SecG
MQQILLALQVLLAVGIIVLVLLQQGRGADAGASFGGGASGSLFGSRGPATFLAKVTGVLATLFFANSIALAYLATQVTREVSVVERLAPAGDTELPSLPGTGAPPGGESSEVPSAPPAGSEGGGTTQ